MLKSTEFGIAICHLEPRGEGGLEGYQSGDSYCFRKMEDTDGVLAPYYRMFPSAADTYYETCSVTTFNKHFTKEKSVETTI